MNNRFPKSEKLVSRTLIDCLFTGAGSKSLSAFPLRIVYQLMDDGNDGSQQVLISVPKRCLHHAVDRNRVKRQVREAYRTHRNLFNIPEGKKLLLGFIYLDSNLHTTAEIEKKVVNLMRRMGERLAN